MKVKCTDCDHTWDLLTQHAGHVCKVIPGKARKGAVQMSLDELREILKQRGTGDILGKTRAKLESNVALNNIAEELLEVVEAAGELPTQPNKCDPDILHALVLNVLDKIAALDEKLRTAQESEGG